MKKKRSRSTPSDTANRPKLQRREGGRLDSVDNSSKVKRRELLVLLIITVAFGYLVWRLVYLQFIKGEEYSRAAYAGQTRQQLIKPKRGGIYDRNGKELAISAQVDTVSVNPKNLREELKDVLAKNPNRMTEIATDLAGMLGMEQAQVLAKLNSENGFEFIKRKIGTDVGNLVKTYIKKQKLGSIFVDEDSKRFYPNGKLASHVLGFTGSDDQGLTGIEALYDATLKGEAGKIMNEVDANGGQIKYSEDGRVAPRDGYDVTLTVDESIQHMTEEVLLEACNNAATSNGGIALVMKPDTGEVLAMASYPDFDPNKPDAKPTSSKSTDWKGFSNTADSKTLWQTVFRNKTVMDTYEPGSTFKGITTSALLEEGIVSPATPVVDRPFQIEDRTIYCTNRAGHGNEDFTHAVYNSCNPVFAKLSQQLGVERFYQYVRLFGFTENTGVECAGEPTDEQYRSLIHQNPTNMDMAVASFGQRFQVSPIQLVSAYCAIANGGSLMKPMLIKQVTDADGNVVKRNQPTVVRRVISEKTSATVRSMLEGVVSEGTGKNARVPGYRLAGKTGTSETLNTDDGHYVVSFISFSPADRPEIVVLIALDWPTIEKTKVLGGVLAAPYVGKLSEKILEYLKVERDYSGLDKVAVRKEVSVPKLTGLSLQAAKDKLTALGLVPVAAGADWETPTSKTSDEAEDNKAADGTEIQSLDGADTGDAPTQDAGSTKAAGTVGAQNPKSGLNVPEGSLVYLYRKADGTLETTTVPSVKGKTADAALATLKAAGLNTRERGVGEAVSQSPAAGTTVTKGDVVEVEFTHQVKD